MKIDLTSKVVLIRAEFSCPTFVRENKRVTGDVLSANSASSDAGRFTQRLMPKKHVKDIREHIQEAKKELMAKALIWTHDKGTYMVPTAHVADVSAKLDHAKRVIDDLRRQLLANIDAVKADAMQSLGSLASDIPWPEYDEIARGYHIKYSLVPLASTDKLVSMVNGDANEHLASMAEQYEAQLEAATVAAHRELAETIRDPLKKMTEALARVIADEDKTRFSGSHQKNLKAAIQKVRALNILDDKALESLATAVEPLTAIPTNLLGTNGVTAVQKTVKEQADKALNTVDALLEAI